MHRKVQDINLINLYSKKHSISLICLLNFAHYGVGLLGYMTLILDSFQEGWCFICVCHCHGK